MADIDISRRVANACHDFAYAKRGHFGMDSSGDGVLYTCSANDPGVGSHVFGTVWVNGEGMSITEYSGGNGFRTFIENHVGKV